MTPTLDAALLSSSRVSADLGHKLEQYRPKVCPEIEKIS